MPFRSFFHKKTQSHESLTLLYHFLISIDKLYGGARWSRKWESLPAVYCLASLTALIPTLSAPQEGRGPKSSSAGGSHPLQAAAAELVCIGANCFFNYRDGGNAACCLRVRDDAHGELLSVMFHTLHTTGGEWGGSAAVVWHCVTLYEDDVNWSFEEFCIRQYNKVIIVKKNTCRPWKF